MRLGNRFAITAEGLREQAEQLGVLDTAEVTVLAPAAYAALATHVWPHAQRPLAGSRGIGDQMARFAALATGRATVAGLTGSPAQAPAAPPPARAVPSRRGYARRRPAARPGCASAARPAAGPAPAAPLPTATGPHRRSRSQWFRVLGRPGTGPRMAEQTQAPTSRSPPASPLPHYHIGGMTGGLSTGTLVIHRTAIGASAHNAGRARWSQLSARPLPLPAGHARGEVGLGTQQRHRHSEGSGPTRAPGRQPRVAGAKAPVGAGPLRRHPPPISVVLVAGPTCTCD
jgi:hypothetical protein